MPASLAWSSPRLRSLPTLLLDGLRWLWALLTAGER